MSKKWIFQDIQDIAKEALYGASSMKEAESRVPGYYAKLREKVEPETYVRYELWTCDIYVDVEYIVEVTRAIYGDSVSTADVLCWILEHKENHHVLQNINAYE